jgi:uncharacterized protein (DUF983 family)
MRKVKGEKMTTGINVSCPKCGKDQFLLMEQADKETLDKITDAYGPDADMSCEEGYGFIGFTQCQCNKCIVATLTVLSVEK